MLFKKLAVFLVIIFSDELIWETSLLFFNLLFFGGTNPRGFQCQYILFEL